MTRGNRPRPHTARPHTNRPRLRNTRPHTNRPTSRTTRLNGARRGDCGLVTLEWILIIGAVAGLAGVTYWLVWETTDHNATWVAESGHYAGASVAAVNLTADARAALPATADADAIEEFNERYGDECARLQVAYQDIDLRSVWVDADDTKGDRFDRFNGVTNPPPRAICHIGTLGRNPNVPVAVPALPTFLPHGGPYRLGEHVGVGHGVHISGPSPSIVVVEYYTTNDPNDFPAGTDLATEGNGCATGSGVDYKERKGKLRINPGATANAISSVQTCSDSLTEPNEYFKLCLRNPVGATLVPGQECVTFIIDEARNPSP